MAVRVTTYGNNGEKSMKIKKCTQQKHKWDFIENVITRRITSKGYIFSKRGKYKCSHCLQKKYGEMKVE